MTIRPYHLLAALLVGVLLGLSYSYFVPPKSYTPLTAQPQRDSIELIRAERDHFERLRIIERERYDSALAALVVPPECTTVYNVLQNCDSLLRTTEIAYMQTRQIEALQSRVILTMDTMLVQAVESSAACEKRAKNWKVAAVAGWAVAVGLIIAR